MYNHFKSQIIANQRMTDQSETVHLLCAWSQPFTSDSKQLLVSMPMGVDSLVNDSDTKVQPIVTHNAA